MAVPPLPPRIIPMADANNFSDAGYAVPPVPIPDEPPGVTQPAPPPEPSDFAGIPFTPPGPARRHPHRPSTVGRAGVVVGACLGVGAVSAIATMLATGSAPTAVSRLWEPRLDATDADALEESFRRMTQGMAKEEQETLVNDMMTAIMPDAIGATFNTMFDGGRRSDRPPSVLVFRPLHGLTAAEIRERAEESRARIRSLRRGGNGSN